MHQSGASRGSNPPVATNRMTSKRSLRQRFSWFLLFVCSILVLNNMVREEMTISSNVVFSDIPNNHWNKTAVTSLPKADDGPIHPATENNISTSVSERPTEIDPFSLKNSIDLFVRELDSISGVGENSLWTLLEQYPSDISLPTEHQKGKYGAGNTFFYYEHDELSSELICGAGPGRGMEQDPGYKLLVEKIRILEAPKERQSTSGNPKVLCMVYTYSPMRHLVRAQALMWGRHCDGFMGFSNETIPELGIYKLPSNDHEREESYHNMWQKSRAIWKYAHDHFLDSFDYFYISGDDVYLMVNNLRAYLQELEERGIEEARHIGSWLPQKSMMAGGPGYMLNRAALQQYVGTSGGNKTRSVWSTCKNNVHQSYEDRFISQCLSEKLGIWGNATDTRDQSTGEQRFHDTDPATLYTFRASSQKSASYFARMAKAWEDLPMPQSTNQTTVGPKHGLEAAAKYSISLHHIYSPTYMARIHAILHRSCSIDSPLGRGLKSHFPEP